MKPGRAVIVGLLLAAISATAQSKQGPVQIVGNAEIIKIDVKKKSLQVRELVEGRDSRQRGSGGGGGGGGGRRSGGGGRGPRGGGGIGFPGGGRYPGGGGGTGGTATNQAKEYKVFVTKDTIMKLQDINIDFSDLHVGDRISVSGTPKGSKGDLEATTITRDLG